MNTDYTLPLLAALACGLIIGVERGWKQRAEADGTRTAGLRTFTLIGTAGGLAAVVADTLSPAIAMVIVAGTMAALIGAFLRGPVTPEQRDATTMAAAIVALLLGLLAGSGQPALAVAGSAVVTLLLASRQQSHRLVNALSPEELRAFAIFAVIAVAVLPVLPNRDLGPYLAWNPFKLWLVVVVIIGLSVFGYVASRMVGESKGIMATAVIGGAYSSTAVTASLSAQLGAGDAGEAGLLSTGIALASAVMYVRVLVLMAILAPIAALELAIILGPAAIVAWLSSGLLWLVGRRKPLALRAGERGKPFRFLPALGFAAACAGAALLVRWAQADLGQTAAALSLFLAGSFDVDAAIVTLSALPKGAIAIDVAALALAGTVAVNMAFKMAVLLANAGLRRGSPAGGALLASEVVLGATLAWRLASVHG